MKDSRPRVRLRLWEQAYGIARLRALPAALPAAGDAPWALVAGHGEVSLLAPKEAIDVLGELVESVSADWRAITLDAVFPLDAAGVLAEVTAALAAVGVSVMAFASWNTDHLLVQASLVGRALAALNQVPLEDYLE